MRSFKKHWIAFAAMGSLLFAGGFSLGKPPTRSKAPAARNILSYFKLGRKGARNVSYARTEGRVEYADQANFEELVLDSDVPVLVDFYADWCGPCRMIAPVLEKLAEETTDARIVKVNVDQNPQLAARYGIHSIPSLLIFEKSRVTGRHVGVVSKAQLQAWLSR
jgi:thioredoxin 1